MLSAAQINGHDDLVLTGEGVTSLRAFESRRSPTRMSEPTPEFTLEGNVLFNKVSSFYYKERARLTFSVSDRFKRDFSLIRGLVEFNRPRNLMFHYDVDNKSVAVDIHSDQLEALEKFMSMVFDLLEKERQFRHALKLVIEFEDRYRLERDSVYAILKNTTAATSAG